MEQSLHVWERSLFLLSSSEWSASRPLLPWQQWMVGALDWDAPRGRWPLHSSPGAPFAHLCTGAVTLALAGVLANQGCCKKQRS